MANFEFPQLLPYTGAGGGMFPQLGGFAPPKSHPAGGANISGAMVGAGAGAFLDAGAGALTGSGRGIDSP